MVQVEASYAKVETTNATVSDVVTRREVVELPLNGRNPLNLIALEPGLVQRTTNAAGSGTHVFGSRDRAHNVTIDGIDANESSVPNPQSNLLGLTPDNVQEYRVVTHAATPEYGRNSGANVTVATRSGTNEFHGDIFYFHRNTALNANEFFNSAKGQPKPVLLLHQWGADGGGPFIKNKTFFFVSYQGNKIIQTAPIAQSFGVPLVLTPLAKQGIFRFLRGGQNSTSLVDPKTGALKSGVVNCTSPTQTNCVDTYNIFDPNNNKSGFGPDTVVNAMLGTFPAPNDYTLGEGLNTAGFNWNPPSQFVGPFWMGRLDHKFNDNNNIFFRWAQRDYNTTQGDFLNARPSVFPGFPPLGEVFRIGKNAAISYRRVFSPNVVNEFTAGLSYFKFTFTFGESNPNLNDPTKDPPWAQDCISTSFALRDSPFTPFIDSPFCNSPHTQRAVSTLQYIDNLSIVHGAHTFKTGINFRFYRHNDSRGLAGGRNLNPEILFRAGSRDPQGLGWAIPSGIGSDDLANLKQAIDILAGIPSQLQRAFSGYVGLDAFPGGLQVVGTRAKQYDWYIQDEWKITRALTMTYGVRWEWNAPPTDSNGGVLVPDKAINGSQGAVTFVRADNWFQRRNANAFAPSVALAWNPRGGKTVYRAGYRMAFDTLSTFQITAVSGNVVGAVVACRVALTNSSLSPTLTKSTTTGCVEPSGLDKTISTGFPLTIASPTQKPSDFFLAGNRPLDTALTTAAFDPNLKIPTVHEWDLTIQRELPAGFTVEIGYIGKAGTHLYRAYDLNQLNVNQAGFIDSFLIARNNVGNGCKADGTGCPAGVTGQTPTLLLSLATASFLNSSTVATQLQRNGIGDLMRRLDSSTNTKWSLTCPTPGTPSAPCFPSNFARPNAQFGQIFYFDSGGTSNYQGGILRLRRRFQRGLTMGFAYTYAKSIDDMSVDPVGASSGGGLSSTNSRTPTDVNNFRLDRSRSDFDDRHVVVANFLYELPFGRGRTWGKDWPGVLEQIAGGWTLTGIYTFQSGEPYTLNSNSRTFNGGQKVGRAEIVGPFPNTDLKTALSSSIVGPVVFNVSSGLVPDPRDPRFSICKQDLDPNFSSTFFCIPAAGSPGMGRNTIQGPGNWNLDFGVLKNFLITERWRFQFRTEFFNVFNRPNFENPRNATSGSPTLTSGLFGQSCCVTSSLPSSSTIIAVGEPNRVIQFSAKIIF
ncbi:MAG: TonB-dependent receptor [Acidobacteria bacterium]|nr:TonB-dependent receptor [Acidobacteriota bacterium]